MDVLIQAAQFVLSQVVCIWIWALRGMPLARHSFRTTLHCI